MNDEGRDSLSRIVGFGHSGKAIPKLEKLKTICEVKKDSLNVELY